MVAAILGDLDAFDELVYRYRSAVIRTARSIVGREGAEDIAQDALILAFKALPSIEDPDRFAPWLMAISRHRALRFVQEEKKHRTGRVALDEFLIERLQYLQPTKGEENKALEYALDQISQEYALILRLRFLDEMPLKRISALLDVPISTVKWRIYKGKQLLKELLERERG